MKVLYIITKSNIGGAQVHLLDVLYKVRTDINACVIVGEPGWLVDCLRKCEVKVYVVPTLVREIALYKDLKAVVKIRKIIKEIQPDIVHCHSSKAGIVGRVAAKWYGVPAIFTAHGWAFTEGVPTWKRYVYKKIESWMANWTKKILCVSEYDKNIALAAMPDKKQKLIAIHNGIVSKEKQEIQPFNSEYLNLIMVARFSPPKNQHDLIDVVHQLNQEGLSIRLTLVGDGPLYKEEYERAETFISSGEVRFLGARTDVEEMLPEYDAFLLISNWEGFPISILEAMRCGLPVIASDVGGVKEAVEDGKTGFLISRGNTVLLAERIRYCSVHADELKHMGDMGREKFVECFTAEIMVRKILQVYRDVLKDKAASKNFF